MSKANLWGGQNSFFSEPEMSRRNVRWGIGDTLELLVESKYELLER